MTTWLDSTHPIKPGSVKGGYNGRVFTASEVWQVKSDNKLETPDTVLNTPGLPLFGSVYRGATLAWCNGLTAEQIDDGYTAWLVPVTYSDEFELNEDPTEDAPRLSLDGEKFEQPFVSDYQGNWVGNTAGDPFDPPISTEDARRIINIEKNMPDGIPSWFLSYENAVNSDNVTIGGLTFTARQLKMDVLRASTTLTRNDIDFVTLSVSLHARKDTWDSVVPNLGFNELKDDGEKGPIHLGTGEEASDPQALDLLGAHIKNAVPSDVIFRTDRIYAELPFATILTELGL